MKTKLCLTIAWACLYFPVLIAAQPGTLVYRRSADYTQQIIYFSKDVAILKALGKDDKGEERWYFEIVRATWGQTPELASYTGDKITDVLVKNPSTIAFVKANTYLVGRFIEFDWNSKSNKTVLFAIRLSDGRLFTSDNEDALNKTVGEIIYPPSEALKPAMLLFDQLMVQALRPNDYDKLLEPSRPTNGKDSESTRQP